MVLILKIRIKLFEKIYKRFNNKLVTDAHNYKIEGEDIGKQYSIRNITPRKNPHSNNEKEKFINCILLWHNNWSVTYRNYCLEINAKHDDSCASEPL